MVKSGGKDASARVTLKDAMSALEKAGTAQARKIYAKHGANEPMFGVSSADLKTLQKKIKVDHELALGLWDTGNYDARTLALKIADPRAMSPKDLDRWAADDTARPCHSYVAQLATKGPHGRSRAEAWLASSSETKRRFGWLLTGALAARDPEIPWDWFASRLATIEKGIHSAANREREAMNQAVITIGGRDEAARKAALASAKRIGKVNVDHGDTECRTPDAAAYIEKAWAHAKAKGFASPALQERSRESMRTRC